jgi:hypothetical protein
MPAARYDSVDVKFDAAVIWLTLASDKWSRKQSSASYASF